MILRFWLLYGLVLVVLFCCSASMEVGEDPYNILGVSRTASQSDVKKAYKKLARNWHPDKNNDPSAQEKFIKINEAYEILSNEEKRRDFDNYGHDGLNRQQNQGQPFSDSQSGFSFFFNDMPYSNQWQSRADHITAKAYDSTVLPSSYEKPYVLEVVSNWCMACMRIESIWASVSSDLKKLGLGTGVINVNRNPRLAERLGIESVPMIIGVINGKVYYYTDRISVTGIKEFVNGMFPHNLIHKMTSQSADSFLDAEDNKPRVILFTPKSSPSLLYHLVAFSNQQRQAFGFVSMAGEDGEKLRRKFRVLENEPTVMIFKEEKAVPEVVVEGSELKSGKLREIVEANKYLTLPRLSSYNVFNYLCPEERFRSQRKLCVILFTEKGKHEGQKAALRAVAKEAPFPDRVQFVYLYDDVQTRFVSAMREGLRTLAYENKTALKLAILWNSGNGEARYMWLPGGWHVPVQPSVGPATRLKDLLKNVITGSGKLKYTARIPMLYDEDAPGPMARIIAKLRDSVNRVFDLLTRKDGLSIIWMVAAVFLIGAFSIFLPQPSDLDRKKKPFQARANNEKVVDPYQDTALGFLELNRYTAQTMLVDAPPGQLTVALLLDAVTTEDALRAPLLQAFDDVVSHIRRGINFKFVWISIPDNLQWCTEVMDVNKFGEVTPGTVLALNGHRKYVSTFKPTDLTRSEYFKSQTGDLMGFNDSDSESEIQEDALSEYERKRQKVLSLSLRIQLPKWFEKLTEGLVKKEKLEAWPSMDE